MKFIPFFLISFILSIPIALSALGTTIESGQRYCFFGINFMCWWKPQNQILPVVIPNGTQGPAGLPGSNGTVDYTNIAFLNNTQNFTAVNTFNNQLVTMNNVSIQGSRTVGFEDTLKVNPAITTPELANSFGVYNFILSSPTLTINPSNLTAIRGFRFFPTLNSNDTGLRLITEYDGASIFVRTAFAAGQQANITNLNGLLVESSILNGRPNITTSRGVFINWAATTTQTVQSVLGIDIGRMTQTNSIVMGIRQQGYDNFNLFAGNTSIGANGTSLIMPNTLYVNGTTNSSDGLWQGANRTVFPAACTGTQKIISINSDGTISCANDLGINSTDYINIAFLNNTQIFTAKNTFRNLTTFIDVNVTGWFNVTNATFWSVLNNVTTGQLNATSINDTGFAVLGNTNVTNGYLNVSSFINSADINVTGNLNVTKNLTSSSINTKQGTGFYSAIINLFYFRNATNCATTTCMINFTMPTNTFSEVRARANLWVESTANKQTDTVVRLTTGGVTDRSSARVCTGAGGTGLKLAGGVTTEASLGPVTGGTLISANIFNETECFGANVPFNANYQTTVWDLTVWGIT